MEPDKKLKVLIVGSGGREHALVLAVKRSPMLDSLVCAPGNGGIGRDCETVNISAEDVDAIVEYVLKIKSTLSSAGRKFRFGWGSPTS